MVVRDGVLWVSAEKREICARGARKTAGKQKRASDSIICRAKKIGNERESTHLTGGGGTDVVRMRKNMMLGEDSRF